MRKKKYEILVDPVHRRRIPHDKNNKIVLFSFSFIIMIMILLNKTEK